MESKDLLPLRFREEAFRRYEPHIDLLVKGWPEVTTFKPAPLAPETFSCRLRDAMTSLYENKWETHVQIVQFRALWDHRAIAVTHRDGLVLAGPRNKLGNRRAVIVPTEIVGRAPSTPKVDAPTAELMSAIVLCLQHGILTSVTITGLDPNVSFETDNIEKINNPDGSITLI